MPEYTIYLAADHRGFEKKNQLLPILDSCHQNVHVEDLGPQAYDQNDDYNDAAVAVAQAVLAKKEHTFGVLVCGSAHGVTMQANRFKGIRAVNVDTEESAKHARTNDYANVICLSADYLSLEAMEKLIKVFCHTHPIPSENYARRAEKLDKDYS